MTPKNSIPFPSNIYPGTNTVLTFDNIDRLEGTLFGGGTSHRVNGIAVQPVTYGPHCEIVLPKVSKTKRRSFSAPEEPLPIYNIGKRVGPIPRKVKEVDGDQIVKESQKKNLTNKRSAAGLGLTSRFTVKTTTSPAMWAICQP